MRCHCQSDLTGKTTFLLYLSPLRSFLLGSFRVRARIGDVWVTGHATSWTGNSFKSDFGVSRVNSCTRRAHTGGSLEREKFIEAQPQALPPRGTIPVFWGKGDL